MNQFLLAPRIIAESNMVAILAERAVALSGAAERLHVAPVPLPLPGVRIQMLWHRRTARDPAHGWLRARVAELFRML